MSRSEIGPSGYSNRVGNRAYESLNLSSSSKTAPLDPFLDGDAETEPHGTEFDHPYSLQPNPSFNDHFDGTPSSSAPKVKQRHDERITPPTEGDKQRRGTSQRVNLFGATHSDTHDQEHNGTGNPDVPLTPEYSGLSPSLVSHDTFPSDIPDVDLSSKRHFESPPEPLDSSQAELGHVRRRWSESSFPINSFSSLSDSEFPIDHTPETHPIGPTQYYKFPSLNGHFLKKADELTYSEPAEPTGRLSPHKLFPTPSSPHRHNPPPSLSGLLPPHRHSSPLHARSASNSPSLGTMTPTRGTPPRQSSSPPHQQMSPHRHPSPHHQQGSVQQPALSPSPLHPLQIHQQPSPRLPPSPRHTRIPSPHQMLPSSPHRLPPSPHHSRPSSPHQIRQLQFPSSPHLHQQQQQPPPQPPSPHHPMSPFPVPSLSPHRPPSPHQYPSSPHQYPSSPHQYPSSPIGQTSTTPSPSFSASNSFGLPSSDGLATPTTSTPGTPPPELLGSYKLAVWTDIFGRCKEVLKRDNIRQKTMAADIGLSGSTLSPMLRGKYRHTKEQHINMLRQWACQKDRRLQQKFLQQASVLNLSNDSLASAVGVSASILTNWIDFSIPVTDRCRVDILILKWLKSFQARETPPRRRRSRGSSHPKIPSPSQSDKSSLGSFLSSSTPQPDLSSSLPPIFTSSLPSLPSPALQSQFSSIQLSPQKHPPSLNTHTRGGTGTHTGFDHSSQWSPNKQEIKHSHQILPMPLFPSPSPSPSLLEPSSSLTDKSNSSKRKRPHHDTTPLGEYSNYDEKEDMEEEEEEEEEEDGDDLAVLAPLPPMSQTAMQLQDMYSHSSLLPPHHLHNEHSPSSALPLPFQSQPSLQPSLSSSQPQQQYQQQLLQQQQLLLQQQPRPPSLLASPSSSSSSLPSFSTTPTSSGNFVFPTTPPPPSSSSPLLSGHDSSILSYHQNVTSPAWPPPPPPPFLSPSFSPSFPNSPTLSSLSGGMSPSLTPLSTPMDLPSDLASLSLPNLFSHVSSPL